MPITFYHYIATWNQTQTNAILFLKINPIQDLENRSSLFYRSEHYCAKLALTLSYQQMTQNINRINDGIIKMAISVRSTWNFEISQTQGGYCWHFLAKKSFYWSENYQTSCQHTYGTLSPAIFCPENERVHT